MARSNVPDAVLKRERLLRPPAAKDAFARWLPRVDDNGKVWVKALAHASLTVGTPYAIKGDGSGLLTLALFDTTFASTTAASHQNYMIGVPDEGITSGVQAWLQIGGAVASVTTPSITGTAGGGFRWVNESVNNWGAGSVDVGFVADFAFCTTSASASTAHDMFLLARTVCGIT